eukprot:2482375-Prymnesium_polylepis.1
MVVDADRVRRRHDQDDARVDEPTHPRVDVVALDEPAAQLDRRDRPHALVAVQRARDEHLRPLRLARRARAVGDLEHVVEAVGARAVGVRARARGRQPEERLRRRQARQIGPAGRQLHERLRDRAVAVVGVLARGRRRELSHARQRRRPRHEKRGEWGGGAARTM